MSLPWVRLDTTIASNHKVLALIEQRKHRAVLTYILGLTYTGGHELDGFIPSAAIPFIHGTTGDAKALVECGLWEKAPGGWTVNGWDEFQVSSDETRRRRERAQAAALKRWHSREQMP